MTKLIWLSDLHFTAEGDVLAYEPRARLQSAIDHINQHHNDSDFCVISGDMVNRGTVADYRALAGMLSKLQVPYLPLVGNHDERVVFKAELTVPENCMEGFIQYTRAIDEGLLICLDTQKPGSDAGEFCEQRCEWLRQVLSDAGEMPVYVFMHHPPMALGLPMQDTENLHDGDALLDILTSFRQVRHLFIGHVHRPIVGTVRGIPFATMRSVLYQAPAPQPEWDWDSFSPPEEAPNLGVLTVSDADVILQYVQFCEHEVGVEK